MKYEFRGKSLAHAVGFATKKQPIRAPEAKQSYTFDAGRASYSYYDITIQVSGGTSYTISWSAEDPSDSADYGIEIMSHDGYGTYEEAFSDRGYWSFDAPVSHEATFTIGVSHAYGFFAFAPKVNVDVSP